VIPLIFRKQIAFYPLAKIQPYLFALGMLVFSLAMTFAGTFGAPRRLWDMTYSGAPFDVQYSPVVDIIVTVMAIGGLIGVVGGAIYILVTVVSVFFGKPLPEGEESAYQGSIPPGVIRRPWTEIPRVDTDPEAPGRLGPVPGTVVLVGIFFLAFMLYYFANWALLSFVWMVG
jgi:cytochrome c oxidase subunit 1